MEPARPETVAVIPVRGAFDYAAATARSFVTHTPAAFALLLDDASPGLDHGMAPSPVKEFLGEYQHCSAWIGFAHHGGPIRSWNHGLLLCRDVLKPTYVCCANSDLLFTPGWFEPVRRQLDCGRLDLVGPLSNAPGPTARGLQDVTRYLPDYQLTDDDSALRQVASRLRAFCHGNGEAMVETPINGFCMTAATVTWWANAYDDEFVFCPRNDVNSKGQQNATPLVTLHEDEFQRRLHQRGRKSGVALGSFVFHYRSVSRGDRHRQGLWYRKTGEHA